MDDDEDDNDVFNTAPDTVALDGLKRWQRQQCNLQDFVTATTTTTAVATAATINS